MRALLFFAIPSLALLGCVVRERERGLLVGHSDPVEQPSQHLDAPLSTRDLGLLDAKTCDVTPLLSQAGGKCARVVGVAATGSEPSTSASAFDGDACTIWNAGDFPPKFVAVDFGDMKLVSSLLVVPEMTPPTAAVKHVIESSDDGTTWKVVYVIEGEMVSGHAYVIPFQQAFATRYLRLSTEKSPSWVAWREITPLACK